MLNFKQTMAPMMLNIHHSMIPMMLVVMILMKTEVFL